MPGQPTSPYDRFLRPLLASRFFTISAVIHLLFVLLFGGTVLFSHYVAPPDFQADSDDLSVTDNAPAAPQTPPGATLPPGSSNPASNAPPPLGVSQPGAVSVPSGLSIAVTPFAIPMPAIAPPTVSDQPLAKLGAQATGPMNLPPQMAARSTTARRNTSQKFGERPPAEQSVMRSLRWLQAQQHTDGTWGSPKYADAFTGLALLCYLGHGETAQNSQEFNVVVSKAVTALVTQGNAGGAHFCRGNKFGVSPDSPYEHAICTYALCEDYTMTKDKTLVPLLQKAIGYIVAGQRSDGGWTSKYDVTPDGPKEREYKSDTSISGWQIQALKSAYLTGIPGMQDIVRPALDSAMKNIDRVYNPKDGTYGLRKPGDNFNRKGDRTHFLTGVGVLSKLFWLGRLDKDTRAGIKDIETTDVNYAAPTANLYAWYYNTQACFQAQGSAWDWWNARFQDLLVGEQSPDGSWPPCGGPGVGGFQVDTQVDGPVYRSTFCCLMLEVFYRYLPTIDSSGLNDNVQGL